jgi:putative ABC transport system ATP-binding protein
MVKKVISCSGITKTYGSGNDAVHALRGIDLEVNQGELFMLVGPSGCGKTTLISIIAGILDPTEGVCEVLGEDVGALSNGQKVAFRRVNVGFVFQAFNLLPALTAAENVAVPLLINKVPRHEAIERATELLEQVGLQGRGKSLPSQLSGGQQQRVAIARALIHEPSIIVCDEPTSALDHITGQRVIELMQKLAKERGHTLVIVTHDARIFEYADRIAMMDDGHITKVTTDTNNIH